MTLLTSEIDEIAQHLLGKETPEGISDALMERWRLDYDHFAEIVEGLLELTIPTPAPITGTPMHVFARREGGHYTAIARKTA